MFKPEIYINEKISYAAVAHLIESAAAVGTQFHSVQLFKDGELLLRIALPPYSNSDKMQMYSLSKSFTSTAIGMLCDDGKLSVEDKIINIFPDKLPETVSENLSEMRVKHLLSMNSGHHNCTMNAIKDSDDAVKTFLSLDVEHKPGTFFCYNTGASFILSAIVTKVTGVTLLDFLNTRLFPILGIDSALWPVCGGGYNEGGFGLHISNDDLLKFGKLYLNGGVYNGKRLLSENWVKQATSFQSDNSSNGTADWTQGYGYQFWLNSRGGYRGDGAFGQACFVFPEKNMIFTDFMEGTDMQVSFNLIYDFLDTCFSGGDGDAVKAITDAYAPICSYAEGAERFYGMYKLSPNCAGLTLAKIYGEDGGIGISFSDGKQLQKIYAKFGAWQENCVTLYSAKPTLTGLSHMPRSEQVRFAAYCFVKDDALLIDVRNLNTPHHDPITLSITDSGLKLVHGAKPGLLLNDIAEMELTKI